MLPLSHEMLRDYDALLAQRDVDRGEHNHYKKWLRYYLDFCHKYHHDPADRMSFSAFHQKLSSKGQSEASCRQAHRAIVLYHEILQTDQSVRQKSSNPVSDFENQQAIKPALMPADQPYIDQSNAGVGQKSAAAPNQNDLPATGASWVHVFDKLNASIKVRHYSKKTLQAYRS